MQALFRMTEVSMVTKLEQLIAQTILQGLMLNMAAFWRSLRGATSF